LLAKLDTPTKSKPSSTPASEHYLCNVSSLADCYIMSQQEVRVFRTDTAGVCNHSILCMALCAISGLVALLSMPFAEGTYRRFLVASVAKPPLAHGQFLPSGCNNDFVAINVFIA